MHVYYVSQDPLRRMMLDVSEIRRYFRRHFHYTYFINANSNNCFPLVIFGDFFSFLSLQQEVALDKSSWEKAMISAQESGDICRLKGKETRTPHEQLLMHFLPVKKIELIEKGRVVNYIFYFSCTRRFSVGVYVRIFHCGVHACKKETKRLRGLELAVGFASYSSL